MLNRAFMFVQVLAVSAVLAAASVVCAQDGPLPTIQDVPVPGGIQAAATAIADPIPPDRSQFLFEAIRRSLGPPVSRSWTTDRLLAHLERAATQPAALSSDDTIPLPLDAAAWKLVLGRDVPPRELAAAILRSRDASRMYCGLLSLDDPTRAWLKAQPALLEQLASRWSAPFVLAAPGLRIRDGRVWLPGGPGAQTTWEALTGHASDEPEPFIRDLLGDPSLAYMVGTAAELTPAQADVLLGARGTVPPNADAAKHMLGVFRRATGEWTNERLIFSRPAFDPALLVADLPPDADGRPVVPGTQHFWKAVFETNEPSAGERPLADGDPVEVAWLFDQVFGAPPPRRHLLYNAVLFAARRTPAITASTAADALQAVWSAVRFPALAAALERAGVDEPAVFAAAARRAVRLSKGGNDAANARSVAQFQGTLAVVLRAALRGSVTHERLSQLVVSLSAVDVDKAGDYSGALARWLSANLPADLLPFLAGPPPSSPQAVEWEGAPYHVDFSASETTRLTRLIDDLLLDQVAMARKMAVFAEPLEQHVPSRAAVQELAAEMDRLAGASSPEMSRRLRDAAADLTRDLKSSGRRRRAAATLGSIADELLARALRHIAYAIAFRQPDAEAPLLADLAARHVFGIPPKLTAAAWIVPLAAADSGDWHVVGALLGLDEALADRALLRLSMRPLTRVPTLDVSDRQVYTAAIGLVDSAAFTDADRDVIVEAMQRGRDRAAAARTAADAGAIADAARLSARRRTLLAWAAGRDPASLATFLSPLESLWVGLGGKPVPASIRPWGAPAGPRLGCVCVQLMDPRPLEMLTGRWGSGLFATGFPDLNLRLAELLAELQMPAALLGPILAPATADFVDGAVARDRDDRRGLEAFVRSLARDRVEQYLDTLTVDGPLVAASGTAAGAPAAGVPR